MKSNIVLQFYLSLFHSTHVLFWVDRFFSFVADCVFEVLNLKILISLVAAIIIMRLTNERDEEKGRTIKSHSQGPRSGDIHFDDDEDWTLGSERGADVIQVHTWQKWRVSYGDIKTLLAWCSWNGIVQNYLWHTMQSSGETSLFRWQFMRLATRWV